MVRKITVLSGLNISECERDRDALDTPSDPSKKDVDTVNIHRKPARPLASEGEEEAESDGEQEPSEKEDTSSEKDESQDVNSVEALSSKVSAYYVQVDKVVYFNTARSISLIVPCYCGFWILRFLLAYSSFVLILNSESIKAPLNNWLIYHSRQHKLL